MANGDNFKKLIANVAGQESFDAVTEANFNEGLNQLDLSKRGRRRVSKGLKRFKKAEAKGREFELGENEFQVREGDDRLQGSGALRGNQIGFNAGDLVGVGNKLGFLAGALQKQRGIDRQTAEDEAIATALRDEIALSQFDANITNELVPDTIIEQPKPKAPVVGGGSGNKSKTRSTVKDLIKTPSTGPLALPPEVEVEDPFAFLGDLNALGNRTTPREVIPTEDTGGIEEFLFGNLANTFNESPLIASAKSLLFPDENTNKNAWEQAKQAFTDKSASNKAAFNQKLEAAKANNESSFEHQGTKVVIAKDGTFKVIEGSRSPFYTGLFTPGLIGGGPKTPVLPKVKGLLPAASKNIIATDKLRKAAQGTKGVKTIISNKHGGKIKASNLIY